MLLPGIVRSILMYGGLAVVALMIVVLVDIRRAARANAQRDKVPSAKVVSGNAERRRAIGRWAPPIVIVVGLVMSYWSYIHKVELVIVEDGANGPTAKRRYASDKTPNVTLAPGVDATRESFGDDPVWVINRSTRTLYVKTVSYGRSLGFGSDPKPIPPSTSAHFYRIDHIGPSDPPPHEVRDEANIGISFRAWLTWD